MSLTFRRALPLVALFAVVAGCDDGIPSSASKRTITAEAFIDAMVELRKAALLRETMVIPAEERDRILGEHGLASEDLLHFVEVHGANVPLMARIWGHVESRLGATSHEELGGAVPPGLAPPGEETAAPPAVRPGPTTLDPT